MAPDSAETDSKNTWKTHSRSTTTIRSVIGDELRKARLAAGLSQEKLGFLAEVSRNYVSMVELNQNSPTVATLLRMCHALGVRAGALVSKVEGDMKRPRSTGRRPTRP